jgi:hypothetical protein
VVGDASGDAKDEYLMELGGAIWAFSSSWSSYFAHSLDDVND